MRARRCAHDRRVLRADICVPVCRELFIVDERRLFERDDRVAGADGSAINLADQIVTVLTADVRPDRLPPPIGKELAIVEILDLL